MDDDPTRLPVPTVTVQRCRWSDEHDGSMFRHVVIWTFPEEADGRSRADNVHEAMHLLGRCAELPGVQRYELGADEVGTAASAHLVLVSDFDDVAAYDAYIVHPWHEEAKAFFARTRDSVRMVDYEI
jgi:hypothetical protein